MDHKFARRAARAAIEQALRMMEIPQDAHEPLPVADDHTQLDARGNVVLWVIHGRPSMTVQLTSSDGSTATVSGDSIYDVLKPSAAFYAEDFVLRPLSGPERYFGDDDSYYVEIDQSDVVRDQGDAWRDLPVRPPRQRRPRHDAVGTHAKRAIGR